MPLYRGLSLLPPSFLNLLHSGDDDDDDGGDGGDDHGDHDSYDQLG